MEKVLKINATEDTPKVIFDSVNNEFSISGRSLPEDAYEFYKPVIQWMREYLEQSHATVKLNLNLDYFNSSSVKQIMSLMLLLEEPAKRGTEAKVIWHYSTEDELMEIKGQEFKSLLNVPFELSAS
jgi:hypothetical protein